MRREIPLSEIEGRTVEGWSIDNLGADQMVITFTDGTFVSIGVELGYDDTADIVHEDLKILAFDREALVSIGIATRDEIEAASREREEKWKADRWERDRKTYERLKQRFEDT